MNLENIKKIALVGATDNKEKFGYKIFKNLISKNFEVYPVNPLKKEIEGYKIYKSIEDLNEKPELIVFVVPPKVTLEYAKNFYSLGFRKFWFQPGTESEDLKNFLNSEEDIEYSLIDCIMVETN